MKLILNLIILQFIFFASNCQMEDTPNCHFVPSYGDSLPLACYGGSIIFEGFFEKFRSQSQYQTKIIYFINSNFHTISALTFNELPDLKELNLNGTGIKILEVDCFKGLKNLIVLELNGNKIEELDQRVLSNLRNLERLNLANNQLHEIHENTFKSLRNLKKLLLDGNNLHFLPDNLFSTLYKIQTIDLSRNYLETLNSSIFYRLFNLQDLYINSNRLKHLPPYLFKDLSNLYLLNISNNSLSSFLYGTLSGLDSLNNLDVSHNQITSFRARNLYFLSNLMELNVEHNNISSLNTDELTIFLPKLKEVYLQGNAWTCDVLLSIIKAFKMTDVQVEPGQNYEGENLIGIECTNSPTNSSLTTPVTIKNNGHTTHEIDESRFLQYNHLLLEIVGKITDNNHLMEQLIHVNINGSKNNQSNVENVQKSTILSSQNMSNSVEHIKGLLENILDELRIKQSNTVSTVQQLTNHPKVDDDLPHGNGVNPQSPLFNQNDSSSLSNLEIYKFMNNMKTETKTILDIFMKNISQTIASLQAKSEGPATTQQNNQLISEKLQKNPSTSDSGNRNIPVIVLLGVLVVIFIIILGIIYIRNNNGTFIANGWRRYRSNRPLESRSDADLMANSSTLSNSTV